MLDKDAMMEDEYGFYVFNEAKEMPLTASRVDKYISFISHYVHTRNKAIKKYEAEGKDTYNLIRERDYALKALGLIE